MRRKKQCESCLKNTTIEESSKIIIVSLILQHYNYKLVIHLDSTSQLGKICSVNQLAERNTASCSRVVRAVANFFLKTDRRQDFCYPTTFKPRFR